MKKKGIYVSPTEFVAFSDPKPAMSLGSEIATRKNSIDFYSLNLYLPNPDTVLKKMGKDIQVYTDLLADGRVWSGFTSYKAGITSLEWEISRGKAKSRQAKIIDQLFSSWDMHTLISQILDGYFFGYKPLEVIWEKVGNLVLPKAVVDKPQHWFVYGVENELRLRTRTNWINGDECAPRKFLCARNFPTYANPYGEPVLSRCFWPVIFKKGGWRFWVTFAEKYGTPFLVGKHPRGAQKSEIDALGDALEEMVQDAIAVIADDASVEIVSDSAKSASSDLYHNLIQEAKREISEVIVGHAGAAESTPGKLGSETAALAVRQDLIDNGKKMVEATLNELIQWIDQLNWNSGSPPTFNLYQEEDIDDKLARRDYALVKGCGVELSQQYFEREYSFRTGDIVKVSVTPGKVGVIPHEEGSPAEFAEDDAETFFDQDMLDRFVAGITTPAELQELMEGVLKPIFTLVEAGGDLQELHDELPKLFSKMDTTQLEEILTRVFFVSAVWGRLSAQEE